MKLESGSTDRKAEGICGLRELEMAGEYCNAGKSGKSIKGRPAFQQMLD